MSENINESRLPPPAFPPGSRRHVHRNSRGPEVEKETSDAVDDAFISPDDPLPERKIELLEAFSDGRAGATGEGGAEQGEVVGMDLDPHLHGDEVVAKGDPHVMEVMDALSKLAEAVRRRGEAGLHARPDMSRFEITLRAYCVGYLAGRRAEDPPVPEMDDALPTDG